MSLSAKQKNKLAKLNPKSKLIKKALRKFGETFDCREAGYILEDGTMLDFKKNRGNVSEKLPIEHGEIVKVLKTGSKFVSEIEAISFFQKKANALRFACLQSGNEAKNDTEHDMYVQLEASQKLTDPQLNRITQCCELFSPQYVAYDAYDGGFFGKRLLSEQIDKPNCNNIAKKIKEDFENAKANKTIVKFSG